MSDWQANDPVGYAHAKDAGRIPPPVLFEDDDPIYQHPVFRRRQIAAYLASVRKDWCPRTEDGLHHPQCGCDDGDAA